MKRKMWKHLASLALATVLTVGLVPSAQAAVDYTGADLSISGSATGTNGQYNVSYSASLNIANEVSEIVVLVNAARVNENWLEALRFTCYLEDELLKDALTESDLESTSLAITGTDNYVAVSTHPVKTANGVSATYKLTDAAVDELSASTLSAQEVAAILAENMNIAFTGTLTNSEVWNAVGGASTITTTGYILVTYDGTMAGDNGFNTGASKCLAEDTCTTTISPAASGGSSSGSGGGTSKPTYPVEPVDTSNGEVKTTPTRASKGTVVTITVTPDFGYELAALSVIDEDGNELKLTDKGDGKYTFVMPDGEVTVKASFAEIEEQPSDLPFVDVEPNSWYSDAVEYVYENDLMNGTSTTTFSPFVTTSRAMILTILARYDGVDTSTGSTWYEAGAAWAVENGVSDGTNLQADLTREQLVTMLWRYLGSPASEGDLSAYPDSAAVSDWAVDAMIWAVNNQVITGNGVGALNPQGTATRAEMAIILMRVLSEK